MGENYFNSLPLRLQLEELGQCRFMDSAEFNGVEALKGKIPAKAYRDFKVSFQSLCKQTVHSGNRRALQFMHWALKDRRIPFNIATIRQMERLMGTWHDEW